MQVSKVGFFTILLSFFVLGCESVSKANKEDLPQEITTYIENNFPDNNILSANLDQETFSKHYEVMLDNNINLDFNENKEIIEINSVSQLPDNVIPKSILNYTKKNYPDNYITDWELEDNYQQIELENGLELEFDMNGNFLRIDN